MNKKKGALILLVTGVAFIVSVILFFSVGDKMRPGLESKYLGQAQLNMFNVYYDAERLLLYVDFAARSAAERAAGSDSFSSEFQRYFEESLDYMNKRFGTSMSVGGYAFTFSEKGVVGSSSEEISIKRDGIEYSVKPSFRLEYNLSGVVLPSVHKQAYDKNVPLV